MPWAQPTDQAAASVSTLQATFLTSFHAALLACANLAMLGVLAAAVHGHESKRVQ